MTTEATTTGNVKRSLEAGATKSAREKGYRLLEAWGRDEQIRKMDLGAYYSDPPRGPDPGNLPAGEQGGDRGYFKSHATDRPADDPEGPAFRHLQVEAAIAESARSACCEVPAPVRAGYEAMATTNLRKLCLWAFRDGKRPERFPDNALLMVNARLYGADDRWLRAFIRSRLDRLAMIAGAMQTAKEAA